MKKTDWFEWRKQVFACRDCSNTTKVWLGALATFADEFGFCFPNQEQIAEAMGRQTKKNLERSRKQAEECGHVVVGHKVTASGKSNNYTLRLTNPLGEGKSKEVQATNPQKVTTNPLGEATNPHRGPRNSSTNTTTNSSKTQEVKEKSDAPLSLDKLVKETSCVRSDFPLDPLVPFTWTSSLTTTARVEPTKTPSYPGQPWMERAQARQAQINAEVLAEFAGTTNSPKRGAEGEKDD